MAKYMMVYKGEATDMSDMTEEEANAVMAKWGAWMQSENFYRCITIWWMDKSLNNPAFDIPQIVNFSVGERPPGKQG